MKLKNTDELRRRAKAHRRMDNYKTGTYGKNAESGDPNEIRGCGIACLAAPHQKGRFAALMEKIGVYGMWSEDSERRRLAKEFGICDDLTHVIEAGFEDGEGGDSDFVVAVTEAMADGVDIRPRDVAGKMTYSKEAKARFVRWLAERCDRPVPRYVREFEA